MAWRTWFRDLRELRCNTSNCTFVAVLSLKSSCAQTNITSSGVSTTSTILTWLFLAFVNIYQEETKGLVWQSNKTRDSLRKEKVVAASGLSTEATDYDIIFTDICFSQCLFLVKLFYRFVARWGVKCLGAQELILKRKKHSNGGLLVQIRNNTFFAVLSFETWHTRTRITSFYVVAPSTILAWPFLALVDI